MPRKKKDGRFINYYIDRKIFERLEQYVSHKGQPMTTAIERILDEYLIEHETEMRKEGGMMMYCPNCCTLSKSNCCPICGNATLRPPVDEDYCYLTEKDSIWASAFAEVLTQNGIPFTTKNVLGAGLAMKVGPLMERVKFYVPYAHIDCARSIETGFFSSAEQV